MKTLADYMFMIDRLVATACIWTELKMQAGEGSPNQHLEFEDIKRLKSMAEQELNSERQALTHEIVELMDNHQ